MGAKGWHTRGYLPHYDGPEVFQHIVFHLHDAVPRDQSSSDEVLDRGFGCAILGSQACARIVAEALLHDDGRKYALRAWCVMPTHVHVLVMTLGGRALGQIVREWKTITAKRINLLIGRRGALWGPDYFDRYMRNQVQYESTKQYIERNPVTAGLCAKPEDWRHGSAGWIG